mgnify:CR=1 FL=1
MDTRNARIGLILFSVYLVLYGGFVFLSAFSAESMEATPVSGVNLAILYGFGLIISAIILSAVYGFVCTPEGDVEAASSDAGSSSDEGAAE